MQDKRAYNYYAFISYSRKDEPWAEWLQKRLDPALARAVDAGKVEAYQPNPMAEVAELLDQE